MSAFSIILLNLFVGLSFKLDNVSDSSNRTELWEIYKVNLFIKWLIFFSLSAKLILIHINVFQNEFHRIYNSTEDQRRFGIFNATVTRILEHNKLYADKKITYTMGINQFTDLDPKEMFHGGVIEVEDLTSNE